MFLLEYILIYAIYMMIFDFIPKGVLYYRAIFCGLINEESDRFVPFSKTYFVSDNVSDNPDYLLYI